MAAQIRIGASGFSYKEWVGRFYPPKTPGAQMLSYYATHLPTVEINYTFRAMPKRSMFEGWTAKTPPDFRFSLKAPQRITHFARLRGIKDSLDYFMETAEALGERLGPVLFQLPPDFVRDDILLTDFLGQIKGRLRAAFEFRHKSWLDDEVFGILRENDAALCIAETEKLSTPILSTARHVYLRLRLENYDEVALARWADHLKTLATATDEIFVYFKHEAQAPELAARLRALVSQPEASR
jgi:uncharacterized protein YecE (DUF72 family)